MTIRIKTPIAIKGLGASYISASLNMRQETIVSGGKKPHLPIKQRQNMPQEKHNKDFKCQKKPY